MTGNPCATFFKDNEDVRDYVPRLPSPAECVAWEGHSAKPGLSKHGPVKDAETLRRRIITPTHIDANGAPTPLCFKDAWDKGLSVDRDCRPEEDSRREAEQWIADQQAASPGNGKSFHGLATVQVEKLRELMLEGQRAFVVFDTALLGNEAHADVCGVGKPNKRHRMDLRASLWKEFRESWAAA